MTYQVADVTKPLNSVTKMCDSGNVVTFTAEGGTIKNLWTGASMHFGRESGVCVCVEYLGKKGSARRNGFRQAGNVISRASRAASPILDQVSDAEEIQEIEESTSDDEEQDPCVLHGIDDESEAERDTTTPWTTSCTSSSHSGGNARTSPHVSRTGPGAHTVCLVVESAPNIDGELLVRIR